MKVSRGSDDKVAHLVVDSGAFIRGSPLQDIGHSVYTIREVVEEIRDKATRERLQCLPYQLNLSEPSVEDIQRVSEFSKKTGDYSNLSAVDIKLIALVYSLEKRFVGETHLNSEPSHGKVVNRSAHKVVQHVDRKITGFYFPKKGDKAQEEVDENDHEEEDPQDTERNEVIKQVEDQEEEVKQEEDNLKKSEEEGDVEEKVVDEVVDEEETSWITAANIVRVKKELSKLGLEEKDEARPQVACITTDFAVQNVLMQMGLKVVSVEEGLVIRATKQFVLRCFACFKITNNMDRKFCPSCGNLGTLKKVSVSVNEKGEKEVHINFRRPVNIRGTRYSIPLPKGGKHSNNPILVEDQPIPQHKATKFAVEEKKSIGCAINDPNYAVRSNPFAINDVYSRASRHKNIPGKANGLVSGSKRNPNAVRKGTGNKKKSNDDK